MTLIYTTTTANTNTPIKIGYETDWENIFTIQRVMGELGLGYGKSDSAVPTYTIYTSQFTRSFNPLCQFSIHFPALETERVEPHTLTSVLTALVSLSKSITFAPAYLNVMGQFCALMGGELPTPEFVYHYPHITMRPYLPHWFGAPPQSAYTLSLRDEVSNDWIKHFYTYHFLRIGLLSQQYVNALDLPHPNP